jgi:hypothetical protein
MSLSRLKNKIMKILWEDIRPCENRRQHGSFKPEFLTFSCFSFLSSFNLVNFDKNVTFEKTLSLGEKGTETIPESKFILNESKSQNFFAEVKENQHFHPNFILFHLQKREKRG